MAKTWADASAIWADPDIDWLGGEAGACVPSRVRGSGRLRSASRPFRVRGCSGIITPPTSTTTGGGAFYDIRPRQPIFLPPPIMGTGVFAAARVSLSGWGEQSLADLIAIEDEELLLLVP